MPAVIAPILFVVAGYVYVDKTNVVLRYCPTNEDRHWLARVFSNVFASSFLGVGGLSFGAAKGIDVAFDLIVGRGGQLFLLWISGIVYMAVLNQILESKSTVSYDLYISVAISRSPFSMVQALIQRLLSTASFGGKIFFMLYSVLYLLAFPTLIATMTSYIALRDPYVVLHNGTTVFFEDFQYDSTSKVAYYAGENYTLDYIIANCTEALARNEYVYTLAPRVWFFVCLFQLIWSLGMYGLWVDSFRKSQMHQAGRRLGVYRGILDVAEAFQNDLGPHACAYSNAELRNAIKQRSSPIRGLSYTETTGQSSKHLTISPNHTDGRSTLTLNTGEYGSTSAEVV